MISRHFYFYLIVRVSLITISAVGFGIAISNGHYFLGVALFVLLVIQTALLINYMNQTNRKIAYLFDSIKNEDFTFSFSEEVKPKSLKALHQSLNRVNKLIQNTQIKNRTQETYYQEILKQANIGILAINSAGHILFSNLTAKKILNTNQLSHIRQLEKVDAPFFDFLSESKAIDKKLVQLTNERETIQLTLKSTEITLDGKALKLITIQDINSELDEKETDSWMKLIRVLTHEIMNSVAPITSISESILNYYKTENGEASVKQIDESRIKNTIKGLEVIKNQGNDLMSFVQSYRSFLSIPVPDKKIIIVEKLLEKVKVLAGQVAGFDAISCQIDSNVDNLEIFADEKQITQILINLSKNAIQSMAGKTDGILTFTSGITADKGKYIAVKDNGPGIPQEIIDQIFIPFFTTKSDGTGIGLSLSKKIMQLHGGNITLQSMPTQETIFTLVF